MKWLIGLILIAGAVGGLIWVVPKLRLSNPWLDGKAEAVDRGDLVIPVSASGTVKPDQLVELKSKAGGRISKVHVKEGQPVNKDDIVIEIDPIDEQRTVDRLEAEVSRAKAAYEQAKIRETEAEKVRPLEVDTAEKLVEQAEASWKLQKTVVEKLQEMTDLNKSSIEVKQAEANLQS